MRIAVNSFRGEAPRVTPRALAANAAQQATNARLLSGDLEAWRQFALEQVLSNADTVRSIYQLGDEWLSWSRDVDVARGAIAGDQSLRVFLTGPEVYSQPRWTNYAMATTGAAPFPVQTRPLGVPGPEGAPTVTPGVDPNPLTFNVNVLDEGNQLATSWTKSPTVNAGGVRSEVTEDAFGYTLTYENNNGDAAWLYRNFGIENTNAVRFSTDVRFRHGTGGYQQMHAHVMNPDTGAGITVVYDNGSGQLAISTGAGWTTRGTAPLNSVAIGALSFDTTYTLEVTVIVNADGSQTVTAGMYLGSGQIGSSVVATNTFTLGDFCGFVNETTGVDPTDEFRTSYDNILVQATGATGYVPVNTATSYVYTYVNDIGEESAPSLASTTVLRPDGVTITVTTPTDVPSGTDPEYGITTKRIYRSVTGATGTFFRFVAEIPLAQADYVDALPDTDLGELLESEDWALPPAGLRGLLALPNGIMAGFVDNQVCLSAQNRPHAWPVNFRQTTDTDVVGIGNIDTTLVIGTEAFPYLAIGTAPQSYSMTKLEVPQACVAKRSIAYLIGTGVVFASPDGLIAIAGNGNVRNLTSGVFTRDQWQALNPSQIVAVAHDDVYHAFYFRLVAADIAWYPAFSSPEVVFSNDNLTAHSQSASPSRFGGVRTEQAQQTGKWYFEVNIDVAETFQPSFGVAPANMTVWNPTSSDNELGQPGVSLRIDSTLYALGVSPVPTSLPTFNSGDRGMVAVDIDNGQVWFGRNGTWANGGDPAAGASPTWSGNLVAGNFSQGIVPAASTGREDFTGTVTGAFGAATFEHDVPEGFTGWADAVVENGAFMLDMKADGFGLVPVAYHATAVHAPPKTDKLFLVLDTDDEPTTPYLPLPSTAPTVDGLTIFEFNSLRGEGHMVYQWKGKLNLLPYEGAFVYCAVRAEDFTNLLLRLYGDGEMLLEVQITDEKPFTLPLGDSYGKFEIELLGTSRVYSVRVGETIEEVEEAG